MAKRGGSIQQQLCGLSGHLSSDPASSSRGWGSVSAWVPAGNKRGPSLNQQPGEVGNPNDFFCALNQDDLIILAKAKCFFSIN